MKFWLSTCMAILCVTLGVCSIADNNDLAALFAFIGAFVWVPFGIMGVQENQKDKGDGKD